MRKGRAAAAGAPQRGPQRDKPSPPVQTNEKEVIAAATVPHVEPPTEVVVVDWRVKYGFLNAIDKLYRAYPCPKKPRMPTSADAAPSWESVLLTKLDAFKRYIEHPKTKPHTKFPYVVIENFHVYAILYPPSPLFHSIGPQWEILNEKRIFFLVTVAPDASKVTEQIKVFPPSCLSNNMCLRCRHPTIVDHVILSVMMT
ncbi:hypothetical protein DYB35_001300 [Aphanomyces astaci]|uniref:Uncharacterized protein n=1 Tax=Aphanomyces astaci TaxID=112090 RepID=A0A418DIB8_APHAT|nr:hypothetical protein DYB35_001300 [Aphanomyces astaci]